MNEIQVFNHEQFGQVRGMIYNNAPWFELNPICKALEIANPRNVAKRLDDSEKMTVHFTDSHSGKMTVSFTDGHSEKMTVAFSDGHSGKRGGARMKTYVNEPGMYRVIMRSNKPEAVNFQMWIAHEVLPSIRKTGAYMTDHVMDAILNGDTTMENVLAQLIDERNKRRALEEQVESAIPKVLFANAVAQSEHDIYVGEMAKILHRKGIHNIGEQRLFKWLMEHGWLMRRKGRSSKYIPTQKAIERGYMRIKELVVHGGEGKINVFKTPLITGKGQLFFTDQILRPIHERGQLAINWN